MLEGAHVLAGIAVILLIAAVAAWANPLGSPQLRRPNGSMVEHRANHQIAALLLLAAVGARVLSTICDAESTICPRVILRSVARDNAYPACEWSFVEQFIGGAHDERRRLRVFFFRATHRH